jgi:hypothetical protein
MFAWLFGAFLVSLYCSGRGCEVRGSGCSVLDCRRTSHGFCAIYSRRYAMNTHTGDTLYAESKVLSKRESKSLALRKRLQITRRSRRKRIRCRCRTRTWRRAPPPLRCGWDLPLARPGRLCGWRGKRLPPRSWPWRSWPALRRHTSTGKVSPLTAIGSPDLTVVAEAKPELIATQDKPAHRAMCWLMPLEATSRTTRGVCASPLPPSADVAFEV